jgi:hypothetical protein
VARSPYRATRVAGGAAHALQRNIDERPGAGRHEARENLVNDYIG